MDVQIALSFVNDSCASTHGNVRVDSIFISASGEWRLGGFEVLSSPKDEAAVLYVCSTHIHTHTESYLINTFFPNITAEYGKSTSRCVNVRLAGDQEGRLVFLERVNSSLIHIGDFIESTFALLISFLSLDIQ